MILSPASLAAWHGGSQRPELSLMRARCSQRRTPLQQSHDCDRSDVRRPGARSVLVEARVQEWQAALEVAWDAAEDA